MSGSTVHLAILVIVNADLGAVFGFMSLVLGVGLMAKYANANPELFAYEAMKPFIKDSLGFSDPSRTVDNIFIDLDRHQVKQVYKEVTGKELVTGNESSGLEKTVAAARPISFSSDQRVTPPPSATEILQQPIISPHLSLERDRIREGRETDVTDSWKINSLKRTTHEYYSFLSNVTVRPSQKILDITLEAEQFFAVDVHAPKPLYVFKQQVYEFMLAVFELPWTEPYRSATEILRCTFVGVEIDAFKGRFTRPLLSAEISWRELAAHAKGFFNAGELKATVLASKPTET